MSSASQLFQSNGMISSLMPDSGITAKQQMQFQEYLSNTAHQREISDLKAAGLNPILSAGGSGASVPNGSQDSAETLELIRGAVEATVSSAKALSNVSQELDPILKGYRELYSDDLEKHEGLSYTGWREKEEERKTAFSKGVQDVFRSLTYLVPGRLGTMLRKAGLSAFDISLGSSYRKESSAKKVSSKSSSSRKRVSGHASDGK